jgi:hypothetical protein
MAAADDDDIVEFFEVHNLTQVAPY